MHTGGKPFKCNQCDKAFPGSDYYKCKQCDKTYSWDTDLNNYLIVHTGGMIYVFRVFNKVFLITVA